MNPSVQYLNSECSFNSQGHRYSHHSKTTTIPTMYLHNSRFQGVKSGLPSSLSISSTCFRTEPLRQVTRVFMGRMSFLSLQAIVPRP